MLYKAQLQIRFRRGLMFFYRFFFSPSFSSLSPLTFLFTSLCLCVNIRLVTNCETNDEWWHDRKVVKIVNEGKKICMVWGCLVMEIHSEWRWWKRSKVGRKKKHSERGSSTKKKHSRNCRRERRKNLSVLDIHLKVMMINVMCNTILLISSPTLCVPPRKKKKLLHMNFVIYNTNKISNQVACFYAKESERSFVLMRISSIIFEFWLSF